MKTIVIFLIIIASFGCEKNPVSPDSQGDVRRLHSMPLSDNNFIASVVCENDPVSPDSQGDVDFTAWSNSLTLADVKAMYNSGASFMSDVRRLYSMPLFSYKDSIASGGVINTSGRYPFTTSEGTTSVRYKDSLIFQNSWNRYYMSRDRSITTVEYGTSYDFKLLRITNESHFPPNRDWSNGYESRENRLFAVSYHILREIDLRGYYGLGEIKNSNRNGVIILYLFDFVRSEPKYQYFMLLDLSSKQSSVFRFDYQ